MMSPELKTVFAVWCGLLALMLAVSSMLYWRRRKQHPIRESSPGLTLLFCLCSSLFAISGTLHHTTLRGQMPCAFYTILAQLCLIYCLVVMVFRMLRLLGQFRLSVIKTKLHAKLEQKAANSRASSRRTSRSFQSPPGIHIVDAAGLHDSSNDLLRIVENASETQASQYDHDTSQVTHLPHATTRDSVSLTTAAGSTRRVSNTHSSPGLRGLNGRSSARSSMRQISANAMHLDVDLAAQLGHDTSLWSDRWFYSHRRWFKARVVRKCAMASFCALVLVTVALTCLPPVTPRTSFVEPMLYYECQGARLRIVVTMAEALIAIAIWIAISRKVRSYKGNFGNKVELNQVSLMALVLWVAFLIGGLTDSSLRDVAPLQWIGFLTVCPAIIFISLVVPCIRTKWPTWTVRGWFRNRFRPKKLRRRFTSSKLTLISGSRLSLDEFIQDPKQFAELEAWLVREFAVENLLFYQAGTSFLAECEEFFSSKSPSVPAMSDLETADLWFNGKSLCAQYVTNDAILQVNLSHKHQHAILDVFSGSNRVDSMANADRSAQLRHAQTAFQEACTEVCELLEAGSFRRFSKNRAITLARQKSKRRTRNFSVFQRSNTQK